MPYLHITIKIVALSFLKGVCSFLVCTGTVGQAYCRSYAFYTLSNQYLNSFINAAENFIVVVSFRLNSY
jgi:archaellum component FlaF (FlaF/FlaG flagellin family)